MMKDCLDYCEESQCNSDFDYVESLFDQGNELECYSCKYGRAPNGNILDGSNTKCSLDSVDGQVESVKCPKLANAACYTAATWHKVEKHVDRKFRKIMQRLNIFWIIFDIFGLQGALIRTGLKYEWLFQFYIFVFVGFVLSATSKIFWPVHFCKNMFSGPSL